MAFWVKTFGIVFTFFLGEPPMEQSKVVEKPPTLLTNFVGQNCLASLLNFARKNYSASLLKSAR